jgi:ribosomal protein L40E
VTGDIVCSQCNFKWPMKGERCRVCGYQLPARARRKDVSSEAQSLFDDHQGGEGAET